MLHLNSYLNVFIIEIVIIHLFLVLLPSGQETNCIAVHSTYVNMIGKVIGGSHGSWIEEEPNPCELHGYRLGISCSAAHRCFQANRFCLFSYFLIVVVFSLCFLLYESSFLIIIQVKNVRLLYSFDKKQEIGEDFVQIFII